MATTKTTAERRLRIQGSGTDSKPSVLILDDYMLHVVREDPIPANNEKVLEVPVGQVLWVQVSDGNIEVHLLARKKVNAVQLTLVNVNGKVHPEDAAAAPEWAEQIMKQAYAGVKRQRKIKVFINPAGGPGKARRMFVTIVEPILRAAHADIDVTYTEKAGHAQELAQNISLDFDAVACLSGDGLPHEVFNGFAKHKYPMRAFRIPMAQIPTGSANATSLNAIGVKEGFDVATATLNVIKGQSHKLDLFSVTTGGKRVISHMTQCVGIMADLDLGTEHLRWMGDARFMYGYLRAIVKCRPCPVKISLKVEEKNKEAMIDAYQTVRSNVKHKLHDTIHHSDDDATDPYGPPPPEPELTDEEASKLPELKHADSSHGWTEFEKPCLYVFAGQGPYVSRDLMQFPVSHTDDGLIDVVINEHSTRIDMLKALDGAADGKAYWNPMQHYYKAHAFRIEPAEPKGPVLLAVDGEAYDFEGFQVEVHQGLGRLLMPAPKYAPDFLHGKKL